MIILEDKESKSLMTDNKNKVYLFSKEKSVLQFLDLKNECPFDYNFKTLSNTYDEAKQSKLFNFSYF